MDSVTLLLQVVLALGIYNVWLLRRGRATAWRGGKARSLREEFEVYGLPGWLMPVAGGAKLLCATLLVAGIWFPSLTRPAAAGLALLMLGAVAMHVKVRDPLQRSLPALFMLAMSLVVAAA